MPGVLWAGCIRSSWPGARGLALRVQPGTSDSLWPSAALGPATGAQGHTRLRSAMCRRCSPTCLPAAARLIWRRPRSGITTQLNSAVLQLPGRQASHCPLPTIPGGVTCVQRALVRRRRHLRWDLGSMESTLEQVEPENSGWARRVAPCHAVPMQEPGGGARGPGEQSGDPAAVQQRGSGALNAVLGVRHAGAGAHARAARAALVGGPRSR